MSVPSSSTEPDTRAPGIVSCIRFRHRRKVDFPHPDGPMIAVMLRSSNAIDTSLMACTSAKNASRWFTSTRVRSSRATSGAAAAGFGAVIRTSSVTHPAEPRAGREAGSETDEEDEEDEDERSRPGEGMPLIIGADGIVEDLKRKRGNWLVQANRPELIAERGEEQRRGLAGDASDGDQRPGDDTGRRRAEHDRHGRPPARVA